MNGGLLALAVLRLALVVLGCCRIIKQLNIQITHISCIYRYKHIGCKGLGSLDAKYTLNLTLSVHTLAKAMSLSNILIVAISEDFIALFCEMPACHHTCTFGWAFEGLLKLSSISDSMFSMRV